MAVNRTFTSITSLLWCLLVCHHIRVLSACENYWQSVNDGASSTRRPFDVCYRSYRDSLFGDYSYRYICNNDIVNENLTANGHTVWKQYFNGVGCVGEPNATLLENTPPYLIYCGGTDCDVVRYRVYNIDPTDEQTGQCNDTNFPDSIKELNDFQERVHVIGRCDDDGHVSDSYFCSNDYFYVNSYNNDKCRNDGRYAAQFYFEGCNDANQYIEILECASDSGSSVSDKGIQTWGIIFIVLALAAVCCAVMFVVYHCRKSAVTFEIAE
eukprot:CAMPEP_0202699308 /NCGR_PEP_ID=MMETSP1385-20130828/12529_1 /ASSEMBLY_ACC=CAM_ASM_000861 /TAXON_ID=933848 /ORGANISM="Elphidium margaritaceum" /LENGTH=267 /DNA_ID=CAMNT_0049356213 /DNA_START=38 /DNA_END=841 /DNA_ORIENTATION=-